MTDTVESRNAGPKPVMIRIIHAFDRVLKAPDLVVSYLIGVALIAIMGTLFVSAAGRYLIGFSLIGGEEAARYMMVWMTFLGMYMLIRKRSHIAIDILPRFAPFAITRWVGVAIGILGTFMMVYMLHFGAALADRMLSGGQTSPVLPIPRGILHLSMPVGAALSALAYLHMTLSFLFDPESERAAMVKDEDLAEQFDQNAEAEASANIVKP
ncbi:TRAP transporter small permease [Martelella limonii]|uniref:TRAP transporter small permease n=1 Tax=Martelella limonii TaxID=1647649 RepID=UPI001580363E|nr:TRAP transporter small permease [Martelella limonii]